MKFEAKKLIEKKLEGEILTEKYHILHIELDTDKIETIWEKESEDYESAYFNGLAGDMDGSLFFIKTDSFLEFCKVSLKDEEEKELGLRDYQYFIDKLSNLKDYTLYIDNKEEE